MRENESRSSGAEKVEAIARGEAEQHAAKRRSEGVDAPERARRTSGRRAAESAETLARHTAAEEAETMRRAAEREAARAEKRVAAAQAKREQAEKKAQIAAEKQHAREERIAQKREQDRERHARAQEERMHRRAERAERRTAAHETNDRTPGFGGWLAAVVALSVAVLALGAIVTVGYFDLDAARGELTGGYRKSVYELSELVENMDANLAKARIAEGNYERQKLLTDLLVQSELAERCLESFPVDGHAAGNLTAFVNRVGSYSRTLLHKLAAGGTLTAEEEDVIEYMYATTEKIRAAMPELIESAKTGTLEELLSENGAFSSGFGALSEPTVDVPKSIQDGPFSKGARKSESAFLAAADPISERQALERANRLFADYGCANLRISGKSESPGFACYNVEFEDKAGNRYFAQITERGGYLALLDSYADCRSHNYDAAACADIAHNFLETCGYRGMRAVWSSEAGTACCVNFVTEAEGVVVYPEMIKVKVCQDRGVVTGLEAHAYLTCRDEARTIGRALLEQAAVERNAAARMQTDFVRLAIVCVDGQDTLAYEIAGDPGGRTYYAYVDANSGGTIEIFVVVGTDRGNALL